MEARSQLEVVERVGQRPPLVVHPLPAAPQFVGRSLEIRTLERFWEVGKGVFALVGIGGAGKTAILRQFLDAHLHDPDIDGALVWSFYDDPDTNAFLRTTVGYLEGRHNDTASGIGWYHGLRTALEGDKRYLLVLDGLERVQRAGTDAVGLHGEMEDPLLRSLLVRLATSSSRSQVVVTSRFPLSDLEKFTGDRYQAIDIDQMDSETAVQLLANRGVHGTVNELSGFADRLGRHALTLDLAASAVATFFDGDFAKMPVVDLPEQASANDQAVRLGGVLQVFEKGLSHEDADLMSRMCIFRFGVNLESIVQIFRKNPEAAGSLAGKSALALQEPADRLVAHHLVHLDADGSYTVHPAVRDHFYRTFRDASTVHGAITQHLLDLSGRPGIGLPTAKASLDLLEELVHHALRSGHHQEAWDVYSTRMGGDEHLNVNLGEYSRSFRILSQMPPGTDPSAEYHCYRAFGSLQQAQARRPQNSYIRLIGDNLAELASDSLHATRVVAQFLRGSEISLPERLADFPLSLAQVYLCADKVAQAESAAIREREESMFQDDTVRCEIALAEVSRRNGNTKLAMERLVEPSEWAMRSGSCEHLAALFLVRGALETDMGQTRSALTTFEEARQICQDGNFRLLKIDVLVALANLYLKTQNLKDAIEAAALAVLYAAAPTMGYVWGECRALRVHADACLASGLGTEAKASLVRLMELQRSLGLRIATVTEQEIRKTWPND
ncbi:MAG: hypothetical protein JSS65_06620 [Armatimonadetes bacterium]|nr:hypothetical protein [Armatimonadota bacterium]